MFCVCMAQSVLCCSTFCNKRLDLNDLYRLHIPGYSFFLEGNKHTRVEFHFFVLPPGRRIKGRKYQTPKYLYERAHGGAAYHQ